MIGMDRFLELLQVNPSCPLCKCQLESMSSGRVTKNDTRSRYVYKYYKCYSCEFVVIVRGNKD